MSKKRIFKCIYSFSKKKKSFVYKHLYNVKQTNRAGCICIFYFHIQFKKVARQLQNSAFL